MDIARVVGTAVSTAKSDRLTGRTLLLVAAVSETAETVGEPYVALDLVGAGHGEVVLVARGSAARVEAGDSEPPVDAAVVAIVDRLDVDGSPTYRKG